MKYYVKGNRFDVPGAPVDRNLTSPCFHRNYMTKNPQKLMIQWKLPHVVYQNGKKIYLVTLLLRTTLQSTLDNKLITESKKILDWLEQEKFKI